MQLKGIMIGNCPNFILQTGIDTTVSNVSAIEVSHHGVKVYPNPVSKVLYFSFSETNGNRKIRITDHKK